MSQMRAAPPAYYLAVHPERLEAAGGPAVKVYNYSHIPDAVLVPVLGTAARAVGLDAKEVVVVVRTRYGGYRRVGGRAYNYVLVRKWFTQRCQSTFRRDSSGEIACRGCVLLRMPPYRGMSMKDPDAAAVDVYRVACHEFSHIKDYHEGRWTTSEYAAGRHRPHDKRPWERRAHSVAKRCCSTQKMTVRRLGILARLAGEVRRLGDVKERGNGNGANTGSEVGAAIPGLGGAGDRQDAPHAGQSSDAG